MQSIHTRKKSVPALARRIVGEVWSHPNNRDRRVRAVVGSLAWQARKRFMSEAVPRPVFGSMQIWLDPRFGSTSNLIYFGDEFDRDEMALMRVFLQPGDRFVDVGANVGTYTLLAATLVGPTGRIDAFEAVPHLCEALRANISLNELDDVVQVHELAVSDHEGTVSFRVDRDVSSRIAIEGDPDASTVTVPCGSLDVHLDTGAIALAKIDVEGAEPAVLRGFLDHLSVGDPPVLLLEVLPGQLAKMGGSYAEVLALLDEAGYDVGRYSADTASFDWLGNAEVRGSVFAVSRSARDEVVGRTCADTPAGQAT